MINRNGMDMAVHQKNHITDQSSDADLLRRASEGDRQAFEALYIRHRPGLFAFICTRYRQSLDYHTAEDVVADVFLNIWRGRSRLGSVRNFRAYLMRIAQDVVTDTFRASTAKAVELTQEVALQARPADGIMEREELTRAVGRAVASLSESRRQALELSAGLSAKQIAEICNCTENAARQRIQDARKELGLILAPCGHSCVIGTENEEKCPAPKKDCCWIKWLYLNMLR